MARKPRAHKAPPSRRTLLDALCNAEQALTIVLRAGLVIPRRPLITAMRDHARRVIREETKHGQE